MQNHARLSFHGAARNVTGSCYILETGNSRVMIDCGYYQERHFKHRNWEPFPVHAPEIDAVLLTHAHLDHCGLIPKLIHEGFKGSIYCTPATEDIAKIVLKDAAHLQEEDAAYKKKRHAKEGRKGPHPEIPLYTVEDAEKAFPHFHSMAYEEVFEPVKNLRVSFHDAGHILGSSMLQIDFKTDGAEKRILFSGDIGRSNVPILCDPTIFKKADYAVVESTYGDRVHADNSTIPEQLADIVNTTWKAGGNIIIPSFAVERTQELLYHLSGLFRKNLIPHIRVFLDSPMAIRVTDVFHRHAYLFDTETVNLLKEGRHPCDFPGLTMTTSTEESKAIADFKEPSIIIAGSGMCTGGRVKHHIKANVTRPESALLFIGYQASGTLGRIFIEGAEEVRIHGKMHRVSARIEKINGFSAHADRNELLSWVDAITDRPKCVFVTHGETEAAISFAELIENRLELTTIVPHYGEASDLT